VTRGACQEVLALAAAGKLTAADIATALDTNTVRLLGRLVQWLQAEPNDQHLLNTERTESLWQLLLLTLANLLKVLQPEQQVVVDTELINRFKQQLQSSGGVLAGLLSIRCTLFQKAVVLMHPLLLHGLRWRLWRPPVGSTAGCILGCAAPHYTLVVVELVGDSHILLPPPLCTCVKKAIVPAIVLCCVSD
jgi:hypothetical protein